jgi:aminopeptidase-like protein
MDFEDEPLFVGPYSIPFSGVIERDELFKHLHTLPHLPDAVPLCPSYYKSDWNLGVPASLMETMTDARYKVHIDSEFQPGDLCIGEVYLPGESGKEIIISTYMCHPMTANDNLSGVVLAVELFRILAAMPSRKYSYRLIIIPETIGSVTFLYHHQEEMADVVGGFAITCCGDGGPITFKRSWQGDSLCDRAGERALAERGQEHEVLDYYLTGSDERQFNAPGFRIPMPCIMRTPPSKYVEYHSSFDTLDLLSPENLADCLQFTLDTMFIVDNNTTYRNNHMTEPFLTGYDLFQQVTVGNYGVFRNPKDAVDPGKLNQVVIHETDGGSDLLAMAAKWDCPFHRILDTSRAFEKAGLIEEVTILPVSSE